MRGILWTLVTVFVPFSLVSVGGGSSVFAAIQYQAVDVFHWMDAREFTHIFAISRVAPGPGSMLATLVGFKAAGIPGAAVATIAMFVPSSILCYCVLRVWNSFRGRFWHTALEEGLAPIGAGLILAGVLAIGRLSAAGWLAWSVAGAATMVLWVYPKAHPLLLLAAGAAIFLGAHAVA